MSYLSNALNIAILIISIILVIIDNIENIARCVAGEMFLAK